MAGRLNRRNKAALCSDLCGRDLSGGNLLALHSGLHGLFKDGPLFVLRGKGLRNFLGLENVVSFRLCNSFSVGNSLCNNF